MPLDPRVRRFLDALGAGHSPGERAAGIEERRAQLAELMRLGGPALPIGDAEDRTLPGPAGPLPVRIYTPLDLPAAPLPGLVYFHGGGLVAGSIDTHDSIGRALCHHGRCRVLSVGYRLAPEHPYPAGLEDACAALAHVALHAADFGIDALRVGVCGDSAGGTLAAAAVQRLARQDGPRLALQLLLCPILDYGRRTGSRRELASGYLLEQATLEQDLALSAPGGTDPADPRISPLRAAELGRLPPTLIHTAEFDPLRDEGQDYFERLTPAGSAVSYTCHAGMIHLFYALGAVIPYARTALAGIGAQIRVAFGSS